MKTILEGARVDFRGLRTHHLSFGMGRNLAGLEDVGGRAGCSFRRRDCDGDLWSILPRVGKSQRRGIKI